MTSVASGNETGPQRPPMTVQVGVSGHRSLPDADADALRAAAAGLFRDVAAAAARLHAADQASGSPAFAAEPPRFRCISGLAAGADSILAEAALSEGWTVVAALPFPRAEFEHDFSETDLPRFQALLARAAIVSELDGDRKRGGEPYADVGRQIVEQSDLLLAVWDSLPPRGPGGTGDVVHQARERRIPVVVLPPTGSATPGWHGTDGVTDIDAIVKAAIVPPGNVSGFPQAYYAEVPRPPGWGAKAVRWFERAVLVGWQPPASGPSPAPEPAPAMPGVDQAFDIADRLAGYYAGRYRMAGLMRYGLVVPATVGAFVGTFGPKWLHPVGYVLQFASLAAIVVFSSKGGWAVDQRRFIAYRSIAEYLRHARLLAALGAMTTPPPVPAFQERVADWAGWYGRAIVRGAGLAATRHDVDAIAAGARRVRAAALDEIAFLQARSARFTALARRMRRIGIGLSAGGAALVALHAGLALTGLGPRLVAWSAELALVIPAMAPVFLGLLGFGEYGRLSTRYAAVADELQGLVAALDRAGPGRNEILPIARRLADVMLAESADWQLLIKARTLSAI